MEMEENENEIVGLDEYVHTSPHGEVTGEIYSFRPRKESYIILRAQFEETDRKNHALDGDFITAIYEVEISGEFGKFQLKQLAGDKFNKVCKEYVEKAYGQDEEVSTGGGYFNIPL